MTEAERSRRRPIIKSVAFSAGEWEAVERRMALANLRFGALARRAILDGSITVKRVAFDPVRFGAELGRIGNNINQIARQANTESVATSEDVKAARALLGELQGLIEKALREV